MKITAFNGSPRAERGNTHIMVKEFLKGAEEAGADVENIFLAKKKINHCRGCFTCWGQANTCVNIDDMKGIITSYIESGIVVFATPVYVDNVTGIMKQFMDRLLPLLDYHMETDDKGESIHRKRFEKYPKIVVISNCGYPEQTHFQVISLLFRRVARNMHSEVIAEIYRGGGELLGVEHPKLEPVISHYKNLLQKAGREIAERLRLSEEMKRDLEVPLAPYEMYREGVNQGLGEVLSS
ncbi:MAG: flavodoxin family protein [Theionarchaea archaeon]|nr:flavodoxin family protein [Theionarchaea archaeon]